MPSTAPPSDTAPVTTPATAPAGPLPSDLPCPEDRPGADVVLYDGQCVFCRTSAEKLQWWDSQGKLAYLSLHDPQVAERWPEVSLDRLHDEMCVVDQQGHHHWGPYAVRYLSRRLPRLWWLAPLMHLPGIMLLARPAYRLVAKNRYLIAGRNAECDTGACEVRR